MLPAEQPSAHFGFTGRRALVMGAGRGIGREIVALLAGCGAQVVAYLLSDAAGTVNGVTLPVDGGFLSN